MKNVVTVVNNKLSKPSIAVGLVLFVFTLAGAVRLDPDLGWHIRAGELLLENGLAEGDPFSYTMPSYPWTDHEWLTNIIIAVADPLLNRFGLSLLFGIIAVLALFISSSGLKDKMLYSWVFIASATLIPFVGIRPQVITWLLLALLLRIILESSLWHKYRFFIPPLFLIWANLHGGFAAGVFILLFVYVLKTFELRRFVISDLFVVFFSIIATFINPHGLDLWKESLRQFGDSGLYRWTINEWMPLFTSANFLVGFPIAWSAATIWYFRKRFLKTEILLYLGLLSQAFLSQRHYPLWLILASILVVKGISFFEDEIGSKKIAVSRYRTVGNVFIVFSFLIFSAYSIYCVYFAQTISERNFYPVGAVQYLKEYPEEGNLFASYTWGGYLIWRYPEKKVFMDGRMPSMKWNKGKKGELDWAYRDYLDIVTGEKSYKEFFDMYQVTRVLWPVDTGVHHISLSQFLDSVFGQETERYWLAEELISDGWIKVYEDQVAVIYERAE